MNSDPATILFATDGTPASGRARGAAAHLARSADAVLHVVHVWAPATTMTGEQEVDRGIAAGVASSESRVIAGQLSCPVAGVHTLEGSRAHGILATAAVVGAGLIVVGGRNLGVVEELFTYRVSEDVIHHSFRPVLLVREDGPPWPPRHVVVGCDLSPEAARATRLAAWIARLSDAELVLVAVVGSGGSARDEATDRLEALAEELRAESGAQPITVRVATSADVPAALRDACTFPGSQLLAIGARGSSAVNRAPEFSVSRSMTHHTHLPLLLVPRATGR
jgi:nucleotide-binding universal stress UspA family protein